jgi:hypothetical protein
MEIKTGEQIKTGRRILRERKIDKGTIRSFCPSAFGLWDFRSSGKPSPECEEADCKRCTRIAKRMRYYDQGNGVYIPVEGEKK